MRWFETIHESSGFRQFRIKEHLMAFNVMHSHGVTNADMVQLCNWVRSAKPGDFCKIGAYTIKFLENDDVKSNAVRASK